METIAHKATALNGTESRVYLQDCMEGMAQYPDKYFDLAVVDPPYGKRPTRNTDGLGVCKKTFESGSDKWDIKPPKKYFDEVFRLSKNQIIWGGNYFIEYLHSTNCILIWDKQKTFNAFADCELAWTSFNEVTKIFRYTWNGMLQQNMKNKEPRIHPTQKPIALYDWIFKNYAQKGMKILDTHLGSGSSRIAADKAGLDFTGFEIDADYFAAANKRFDIYKSQLRMF